MKRVSTILLLGAVLAAGSAQAAVYSIDPVHSSVSFKVKHMVISHVTGNFTKFSGTFNYDASAPGKSSVEATIDAASIDTRMAKRDEDVRSPSFLDVVKYPQIVFKSTQVAQEGPDKLKVTGDLTLHGVTKSVILDVTMGGETKDPWGNTRAGFEATTSIKRQDFNLTYNKLLESGGLVVGEDVDITLEIEGVKAK